MCAVQRKRLNGKLRKTQQKIRKGNVKTGKEILIDENESDGKERKGAKERKRKGKNVEERETTDEATEQIDRVR